MKQSTNNSCSLTLARIRETFFNFSKVTTLLIFSFLSLNILSCSESRSFEGRLENFYALLDNSSISAFKDGNLDTVVDFIRSKQADIDFSTSYTKLKKIEAINLFNDKQVVDFFYENFYQKQHVE